MTSPSVTRAGSGTGSLGMEGGLVLGCFSFIIETTSSVTLAKPAEVRD